MIPTLEIFRAQIVLVGDFNPPIFSPEWLNANGLLGDDDTTDAKEHESLVISPTISRFETEWFSLQVIQQQFVLASKGPVTPLIRDLAIGIFTLVDQTPVSGIGHNFWADYKMPSAQEWHKVGDILAPKKIWRSVNPDENQSIGMSDLTIEIDPVKRCEVNTTGQKVRLTVAYSRQIQNGVSFFINNHYPISPDKIMKTSSARSGVDLISKRWETDLQESKRMFDGVLSEVAKVETENA